MLTKIVLLVAAGSVLSLGLANAATPANVYINPINGTFPDKSVNQKFENLHANIDDQSIAMYQANSDTGYPIFNQATDLVIKNGQGTVLATFTNQQMENILNEPNVKNVNLAYSNPSHRDCLASTVYQKQVTVDGQALDICLGTHS